MPKVLIQCQIDCVVTGLINHQYDSRINRWFTSVRILLNQDKLLIQVYIETETILRLIPQTYGEKCQSSLFS
jgi:hypothetical protein